MFISICKEYWGCGKVFESGKILFLKSVQTVLCCDGRKVLAPLRFFLLEGMVWLCWQIHVPFLVKPPRFEMTASCTSRLELL